MSVFDSNVEMAEPESVVGFFVPASSAAYVTELMELAFHNTTGITVYAGMMSRVVSNTDSAEPDSSQSPNASSMSDSDSTDNECQDSTISSSTRKRKTSMESDHTSKQKKTEECGSYNCVPGTTRACCMHKIADQLKQTYGEPMPLPNGKATAPRLMIQYPDLPYSVPLHPEFENYGLPRKVVNFHSLGSFKADGEPAILNGTPAT